MDKELLIQGVIAETLSDDQMNQFLELLERDAIFKEEFEQYQNVHVALKERERLELKKKLRAFDAVEKQPVSIVKIWMVAASIAVLLGVGGIFVYGDEASPQELYAANFETYPNTLQPIVRGSGDANTEPFLAYEKGNYDAAADGFLVLFEESQNPDVLFYYTMSLMNIDGNDDEVLLQLTNLEKTETRYTPQILWYSALVALKKNNTTLAKKQLEKLVAHPAMFKEREAKVLLDKID